MARRRGGLTPIPSPDRLIAYLLSLRPTTLHILDSVASVKDIAGGYTATWTGTPAVVGAKAPMGRAVAFHASEYASASSSVPTPTASMSAMAIYRNTTATGATHRVASRMATSQHSWTLLNGSTHRPGFYVLQSTSTPHASAQNPPAPLVMNDGLWHVQTGTFDGTTITQDVDGYPRLTSTSLTGSWHKASTAGLNIGHGATVNPWDGDIFATLYWVDRVLVPNDHLGAYALVAGG